MNLRLSGLLSAANSTAAIDASAAVASTAVGASASRSIGPTTRQPSGAPIRSAAYNVPTCPGNRVSASETTIPLITNGTDKAARRSGVDGGHALMRP